MQQLVAGMVMQGRFEPVGEIFRHCPNGLGQVLIVVGISAVGLAVGPPGGHGSSPYDFGTNSTKFGMTSHFRQA
jgi:hypothetical protein